MSKDINLTNTYELSGHTTVNPWIGLENPDGNACSGVGCDGQVKWSDGSSFHYDSSFMANLQISIQATDTGTFFESGAGMVVGHSPLASRTSGALCMSTCSALPQCATAPPTPIPPVITQTLPTGANHVGKTIRFVLKS